MNTDTLAEWLRRRPAKPLGSARVSSNLTAVAFHLFSFVEFDTKQSNYDNLIFQSHQSNWIFGIVCNIDTQYQFILTVVQ